MCTIIPLSLYCPLSLQMAINIYVFCLITRRSKSWTVVILIWHICWFGFYSDMFLVSSLHLTDNSGKKPNVRCLLFNHQAIRTRQSDWACTSWLPLYVMFWHHLPSEIFSVSQRKCFFFLSRDSWDVHPYLCSNIRKMRQSALPVCHLRGDSVFVVPHVFKLGQPQTVAFSLSWSLLFVFVWFLLCRIPALMSDNPPGVTFKFTFNNSPPWVIQPPSHTLSCDNILSFALLSQQIRNLFPH